MKRSLTGIKPTGTIHVGNYLGAMRPALRLVESYESSLYFIADYHALTTVHDRRQMHT
ncbi:MAG: trpS, partial [Myxococcaceae bacterium]|nr:trpS [Myxococcaceae bacterium]